MPDFPHRYSIVVAALWLSLGAAGVFYARWQQIPAHAAFAILASCLVEIAFYVLPAFIKTAKPLALVASALPPYLIYSALTGTLSFQGLMIVVALAAAVSYWFVILPRNAVTDSLFLAMMATVFLSRVFAHAYAPLSEAPKVPVEYLGRLMWIRLGISAALSIRGVEGTGYGFIPLASDWKIGFVHYLSFLPFGAALNYATGFAHLRPAPQDYAKLAATAVAMFLGMLWVTALCEEFFFRGMLQQWMEKWTGNSVAALAVTSILFGSAHLVFPRMAAFPNWRFALLATIAGVFYGRAFQKARSIRAAMVTHALVNITWRVFFA